MSRNLGEALSYVDSYDLELFYLVSFYFDSATLRITDYFRDIKYNFGSGLETFISSGSLVSIGSTEESTNLNNTQISITMSGADSANIALAMSENYLNKRVLLRRGFFNNEGTEDVDIIRPFIIFDGRISSVQLTNNPQEGDSNVVWTIASHWADFDKKTNRKCTNEDAKAHGFTTETGFDFIYNQIGDRTWGRIRSRG